MARVRELWDSAPLARFAAIAPEDASFGLLRFWSAGTGVRGPANAAAVAWMTGGTLFCAVIPAGCAALAAVALSSFSSAATCVFTALTLVLCIVTAAVGMSIWFMDPGVAPRHMLAATGNRRLVEKLNSIMPRVIHMKLKQSSMQELGLSQPYAQLRWCDVCLLYKPATVSHASSISSCVYGFDHFCGVLGQVVGRNNRKRFVWLLLLGGCASMLASLASLFALGDFWTASAQEGLPWGQWGSSVPMRASVYVIIGCIMMALTLRLVGIGGTGPRFFVSGLWFAAQTAAVAALTAWLPLPMTATPYIMFVPSFVVGGCALLSFAGYHFYLIANKSTTKDALKAARSTETLAHARTQEQATMPTANDMPSSNEAAPAAGGTRRGRGGASAAASGTAPALPVPPPALHTASDEEDAPLLPTTAQGLRESERRAAAAAALGLPTTHALVQDATAAAMAAAAAGETPRRVPQATLKPTIQLAWEATCTVVASSGAVWRFLSTREEHRCIDWMCVVPTRVLGEFADAVLEQLDGMNADTMARHMLRSDGSWAGLGAGAPGGGAPGAPPEAAQRVEELSKQLVEAGVWGLRVNSLFLPPFVMGRVVRASAQAGNQSRSCCGGV